MAEEKKKQDEAQDEVQENKEVTGSNIRDSMATDERAKMCVKEVDRVLDKWNCVLDPFVTIAATGVHIHVKIVPLQERKPKVIIPVLNLKPENENDPKRDN